MATEENLARQRQIYGEPLADIAGRIRRDLSLTQAGLQALIDLARQASRLTATQRAERLTAIKETTPTISTSMHPASRELRNAAPKEELLRLAGLTTAPELSRLLRIAAGDG